LDNEVFDSISSLGDVVSEDYTTVYTELNGFGTTGRCSNLVFYTAICPVGPKEKERQRRCKKYYPVFYQIFLVLRTSCNKS